MPPIPINTMLTLTWSSANVTNANARKGLGMKTSVTSPYCMKYCLSSSVVMSSVHRPTKILRLRVGSSGQAWEDKESRFKLCKVQFQCKWERFRFIMTVNAKLLTRRECAYNLLTSLSNKKLCPTYLWVGKFAVTPPAVNHVSLSDDFGLCLILSEPNEPETFWVTSFCISLHLERSEQALLPTQNKKYIYFVLNLAKALR